MKGEIKNEIQLLSMRIIRQPTLIEFPSANQPIPIHSSVFQPVLDLAVSLSQASTPKPIRHNGCLTNKTRRICLHLAAPPNSECQNTFFFFAYRTRHFLAPNLVTPT